MGYNFMLTHAPTSTAFYVNSRWTYGLDVDEYSHPTGSYELNRWSIALSRLIFIKGAQDRLNGESKTRTDNKGMH